jgi:hypothetical protein
VTKSEVGIFSVDPGGHSGVAWGIFDTSPKTIAGALATKRADGSETYEGDWHKQVAEISEQWRTFLKTCVHEEGLSPEQVEFVCENFIQIPGLTAGGTDSTLPLLIIGGIYGYRLGALAEWERNENGPAAAPSMILQLAGQASTFATGQRLREWGLWVRGREHERSAWKHVALRIAERQKFIAND